MPYAYIECHIEQGPIPAEAGVTVGIGEGVQSISWQRLTVRGEAAHAGTTPIGSRHDAGLVAASVVVELRRMSEGGEFGQLRPTVGTFDIGAGQTNVIPHHVSLTVDPRNPCDELMTAAERHLAAHVDTLATDHGVHIAWGRMAKTAVVPFHTDVQELLARTADDLGLPDVRTMSGAGHDAPEIAATCPTAMVFVAGEHGGITHTRVSTPPPTPAATAPTCSPTRSVVSPTSADRPPQRDRTRSEQPRRSTTACVPGPDRADRRHPARRRKVRCG